MYQYNIHRGIYKFYFFCLPLGHVFNLPFNNFIHSYIPDFSTIIAFVGLIALSFSRPISLSNSRINALFKLYLILALYSVFAAFFLTFYLKNPLESPFRSIIGDIALYLVFVLSVYYNSFALSKFIKLKSLYPIMKLQVIILLCVGFLQFLSMKGINSVTVIYNILSNIFSLRGQSWLSNVERGITFFGTEPSSASLICFLTIPFVLLMILKRRGISRIYYIVTLILFAVLFLSSNSSSAQISFLFVLLAAFLLCVVRINPIFFKIVAFIIGLSMAIMYTIYFASDNINLEFTSGTQYVLLGKLFDTSNYSTITRSSTIINDMLIFKEFPLTGVGNGNQGFFFNENVPFWMNKSVEVEDLRLVIPNGGGNFFPSFISAFGLIGIILLSRFLFKFLLWEKNSILNNNRDFALLYNIIISLFLLTSWYSVSVKSFEIMAFIISLPLIGSESKYSQI